jgi:NADH-quinone oxidoreductase subunit M
LAGFWGEFPAILSSWSPSSVLVGNGHLSLFRVLTVFAALGTVLAAGYLLWLYQRTAFGEPSAEFAIADDGHGHAAHGNDHHNDIHDVSKFEWMAWTPLLIAIVVFGVVPSLMFKIMDPAVQQLTSVFGGK